MTERQIQNALFWPLCRKGHQNICPNYTPRGWWECDLFSVTRAGFMVEHEIKISVADFRNDAKKEGRHYDREARELLIRNKHAQLALADPKGPARFFYVVPEGLVGAADVPEWAGLIHMQVSRYGLRPETVKEAPKLHRVKADSGIRAHVESVFAHRYWRLRLGQKETDESLPTPNQ